MAGWDEEALLLASLVVEDTSMRESRHRKRPSPQFKTPPTTNSNRKRRSRRQSPTPIPPVVLCPKDPVGAEPPVPEFRRDQEVFWGWMCPGTERGLDDPLINPFADGAPGLEGLAGEKMLVCLAEDVLVERGRAYYKRLKGSGWRGRAELLESEGEDHVFFLFKPDCPRALELIERVAKFIDGKE